MTTREVVVALRLQSQMQQAARDLDAIADKLGKVGEAGRDASAQGGLAKVGADARDTAREVEAARTSVSRLADGIKAAAAAGSGQSPFIAALREQIALYGKGTDDVLRYRAAQAGVGAEAAPLILQLQNMRAAHEAAARAAQDEANAQRLAAAAAQQSAAQRQAFVAGLREQVALQGKSGADVLRYRAGALGIGSEAEQYIAEIEKFEGAASRGGKALNRFGVTAGQQAAAMRMLPAQITDITTSIASGMPVWLVAIQQGGQIRDSFGSWAGAAHALKTVLTPTRVAIVGVAAAVGLALAALRAGQADTSAFNRAVEATGNYAGVTRGQIEAMAESAARTTGIARGAARDVAVQMVASGRLGAQTIANLTQAVQGYAAATGQSVGQAAKALTDAFDKPSEGAEKLNRQFNFLTLEQLRYIRQLEEQGQVEAARLALSERFASHIGGTFVNNLGYLERAWNGVANAVKNAVDWVLKFGRGDTVDDEVAAQRKVVDALQAAVDRQRAQRGFGGFSREAQALSAAQERLAALEEQKRVGAQAALAKAERAQLEERRIELDKKLRALSDTLKTNRQKLADEKKLLDEALKLNVIGKADYDRLLAAAQERYRDKGADRTENAFLQQRQQLTTQLAEAEQRLSNVRAGVADNQDRVTVRLEAWLATNRQAAKLTGEQEAELRRLAASVDAAAKAYDEFDQAQKRAERITAGLADVESALAAGAGRGVDAAVKQIEERFRKLRADLAEQGDFAGLVQVDKLIDVTRAKAQLQDLQREVELIFGSQSRAQQLLQAEVSAGVTSELAGRQQLLDINARTVQQVEALLPRMRELAALTEDPQIAAGVADLEARVATLKLKADELKVAFGNAFSSSLTTALNDLADGTASLGDAARDFVRNMALAMADWAAQQLAMQATAALMRSLGAGTGSGTDATASTAAAAAALAAAGTSVSSGGGAVTAGAATLAGAAAATTTGAGAVTASATALGTAGGTLITGAAAISAAAAQLAAANAVSIAAGFASGGYTGAGGKYQVAGIVHAGEFVHRQEVVRQPGALAFLSAFNRMGMRAIEAWRGATWPGYASGGLVVPAAPSAAGRYDPVTPQVNTQVSLQQRLLPVLDEDLIADALRGPKGEQLVELHISRNPARFRQLLGV